MRGTAAAGMQYASNTRFIPACAGNSRPRNRTTVFSPVHPRVCGEQIFVLLVIFGRAGSSPRVRGTVDPALCRAVQGRFIPACAGNSRSCVAACSHGAVHPRVCGEQFPDCRIVGVVAGSSPRVRGTVLAETTSIRINRFIPACAGNRFYTRQQRLDRAVHPRVCGEQRHDSWFS